MSLDAQLRAVEWQLSGQAATVATVAATGRARARRAVRSAAEHPPRGRAKADGAGTATRAPRDAKAALRGALATWHQQLAAAVHAALPSWSTLLSCMVILLLGGAIV